MSKRKVIILLIIFISIISIILGYKFINKNINYNELAEETFEKINDKSKKKDEKNSIELETKKITIHIAGAVKNSGLIQLEEESRIADAIEAAGGICEEADLSNVNLAYKVEDGMKVYIPFKGNNEIENNNYEIISKDAGNDIIHNSGDNITKTKKININTATQEELEKIPGIGGTTAIKIIQYRNEHGKFKSIEEIKNVGGIGESKFLNIKEWICI